MGELYVPQPDQFTREAPAQPKRVVGEYVAAADLPGVFVPTRYADLAEAQYVAASGTPVLARSGHPDEYDGPSGLGHSAELKADATGAYHPKYWLFTNETLASRAMAYARVAGLDAEAYLAAESTSYWELIPGVNVTVVADDAIDWRYHVFGCQDRGRIETGALVTADGMVERVTSRAGSDERIAHRYPEIIAAYNAIRNLPKFNSFHCPIMEMQIGEADDRLYFLQYHRSRDRAPTVDRLNPRDFDKREGWQAADMVRGAHLGHTALELALWYRGFMRGDVRAADVSLPEDGYLGNESALGFLNECIGRQRTAHVMPTDFDSAYISIATNHGPRSQMFKPQVSVLAGRRRGHDPLSKELEAAAVAEAFRGHEVRLGVQVVSDGSSAFLRYGHELIIS